MEFKPMFKEREEPREQYYFDDGKWIKCDEEKISELWFKWVVSDYAHKEYDSFGFLVFGHKATTI